MMENGEAPQGWGGVPTMPGPPPPLLGPRPVSWPMHSGQGPPGPAPGMPPPIMFSPSGSTIWHPPAQPWVGQRLLQLERDEDQRKGETRQIVEVLQATVRRVEVLENNSEKEQDARDVDRPPVWASELHQMVGQLRQEVSRLAGAKSGAGSPPATNGEPANGGDSRPDVTTQAARVAAIKEGSGQEPRPKVQLNQPRSSEPDLIGRALLMALVTWVVMVWCPTFITVGGAQGYQLHALQCEPEKGQSMMAFSLPVQCKARNRDGADEFVYSTDTIHGSTYSTTSAYLLQKKEGYELVGKRCSKRISTDTHHCGMLSYESPETTDDRVYEKVLMTPSECEEAMRGFYTDAVGQMHHVATQGVTYLSFMSLGELSRKGETVACRGETTVINGRRLTGVVQRTHVEIELSEVEAVVDRRTRDVVLPASHVRITPDKWSKKGFGRVAEQLIWLPLQQVPPCPYEIAKGPLLFLEVPALNGDENTTVLLHAPSKLRLDMGVEQPVEEECAGLLEAEDHVYQTNYRQLYLLKRGGASESQRPLQLLTAQVNDVQDGLVAATQNDFVSYVLQDSLNSLRGEVEEGGCLSSLAQTYALRHRQARGNLKVVVRNDLVYLLPCRTTEVTAMARATNGVCSDQLTVKDKEGRIWQMSPVDRLLVKSVRQVPCASTKSMGYAYRTLDNLYITQNPDLKRIVPPTDPQIRDQASRLWNEYRDAALLGQPSNDSGPYSAAILEEYEGAFLREWTVASRPAHITHDPDSEPAVQANAARHQQFLSEVAAATGGGISSWFSSLKGDLLTTLESGAITLTLHIGSVAGLLLAIERICVSICHGARVMGTRREGDEGRPNCQHCKVGWAAVCCPLPLLMWALLAGGPQEEEEGEGDDGQGYPMAPLRSVAAGDQQRRPAAQLSTLYQMAADQLEQRQ